MENEFLLASDVEEIVERLGPAVEAFAGRTIVVSGARGFLGRYYLELFSRLNTRVLKEPVTVIGLDNLITAGKAGEFFDDSKHVKFVKHDVIGPFSWEGPLHYVIHAAGIASPFYYRAFPMETLEVAITGTKNMLNLANSHGARFVFYSSSEIYGDPDPKHVPIQESYRGNVSCQGPRACYDESKRVGETLCYIYHNKHGTHTNVIRPFNVFGPGMQETDYRVMPNFASRIKGKRPLHIYGRGDQTRTFCYVTDAMVGFLLVLARGVAGEAYNIGNPVPEIGVLDLARRMGKAIGRELEMNVVEYPDSYPADEPQRRCPDIRKARLQLGYEPMVDLDEGLRRFLSWTDKCYTGKE